MQITRENFFFIFFFLPRTFRIKAGNATLYYQGSIRGRIIPENEMISHTDVDVVPAVSFYLNLLYWGGWVKREKNGRDQNRVVSIKAVKKIISLSFRFKPFLYKRERAEFIGISLIRDSLLTQRMLEFFFLVVFWLWSFFPENFHRRIQSFHYIIKCYQNLYSFG